MANAVGGVKIDVTARVLKLEQQMARGAKAVRRFGGAARRTSQFLRRLAGVATAYIGVRAMGGVLKSTLQNIDTQKKFADRIGISSEGLGRLEHAAGLAGVQTNTLRMGMQRMTRRVAEAAQGLGEARGAIQELGLDARQLAAAGPEEAFKQIADAMLNVTSASDQVRLSFKLFDSEGVALVNLLRGGSAALEEWGREAERLGLAISDIDAQKIEEANNAVLRAQGAAQGLANTLATRLAPEIEKVANFWAEAFTPGIRISKEANAEVLELAQSFRVVSSELRDPVPLQNALFTIERDARLGKLAIEDLLVVQRLSAELQVAGIITPATHRSQLEQLNAIIAATRSVAKAREEVVAAAPPEDTAASSFGATLAAQTEALVNSLRTQEEVLEQSFLDRGLLLVAAWERDIITTQNFQELSERLDADHERARTALLEQGASERERITAMEVAARQTAISNIANSLVQLTAVGASESRSQFETNKSFAIGAAVINTAVAIMNALADTQGTSATRTANAVAAGITGAAQIATISATSFGGGGSVAPVASSQGVSDDSVPTHQATIIIEGDNFGPEHMRRLAEGLGSAAGDGVDFSFITN